MFKVKPIQRLTQAVALLTFGGALPAHAAGTLEQRRACRADTFRLCREAISKCQPGHRLHGKEYQEAQSAMPRAVQIGVEKIQKPPLRAMACRGIAAGEI